MGGIARSRCRGQWVDWLGSEVELANRSALAHRLAARLALRYPLARSRLAGGTLGFFDLLDRWEELVLVSGIASEVEWALASDIEWAIVLVRSMTTIDEKRQQSTTNDNNQQQRDSQPPRECFAVLVDLGSPVMSRI